MKVTYWTSPLGKIKFYSLPGQWRNISPFTEEVAISKGWAKHEEEKISSVCTKYQFINALKKAGDSLYKTFVDAYSTNNEFAMFWNTVIELDRENEDFKKFTSELGVAEKQIEEIFGLIE